MCNWTMDFLMGRPQGLRISNSTSSTLTLKGFQAPQRCILSSLLYSLFTVKMAYGEEIRALLEWVHGNDLSFSAWSKMKKMTVDYRKLHGGVHAPVQINRGVVERARSFMFLTRGLMYQPCVCMVLFVNCAYTWFYALNGIYQVLLMCEDVCKFLYTLDHSYARTPICRKV